MKTYTFKKTDNRWFIELPEYSGPSDDLEMVAGADDVCEYLANKSDTLKIALSESYFNGADFELTLIGLDDFENAGATYSIEQLNFDNSNVGFHKQSIWLCEVTKFIFGYFPNILFFKKINI